MDGDLFLLGSLLSSPHAVMVTKRTKRKDVLAFYNNKNKTRMFLFHIAIKFCVNTNETTL